MNGGKARHISGMGDLALSMSHCQGASVSERCDLRTAADLQRESQVRT